MERTLKKHVLSQYASVIGKTIISKKTFNTDSIEVSDPDEFKLSGPTQITKTIESSDPDEMYMGPTKNTYTLEASDEDEFLLM